MKRKSSPIPPGVIMLYTDVMDFHLKKSDLGYVYWWGPDFNDMCTVKARCASVINYKASQDTIDNQKRYLGHKYINSLELEYKRTNGNTHFGYGNPSPFANLTPNITIQHLKNDPISGIKVLGTSPYLGNQTDILVLLPGDYIYTFPLNSFVEAVARGKVVNGVLEDEFIWASVGKRYSLIRKDSPLHEQILNPGN